MITTVPETTRTFVCSLRKCFSFYAATAGAGPARVEEVDLNERIGDGVGTNI